MPIWVVLMVLERERYFNKRVAWCQILDTVVRCYIDAFNEVGGVPEQCAHNHKNTGAVLGEPELAAIENVPPHADVPW